jgi:hypothetical protein
MSKLSIYRDESLGRFIKSHPEFKWDFGVLSRHPDLTLRVLEMFPDSDWDWSKIPFNRNFKWEWVQRLPNKPWPWEHLQFHEDFVWRWVYEMPESPWNWAALSHEITSCWQISHFSEKPWDWLVLTLNDFSTIEFIMSHADFPWVIGELFFRNINKDTIRYLRMFKDRYTPLDWKDHTRHASWSIIKQNLDLPWDLGSIQWRPGDLCTCDTDFIARNRKDLNMRKISEIINYHGPYGSVEWDLKGLSRNPTFTNVDLPKKIDGYDLNVIRVRDETHLWHAAQTIKRHWKRAITDPSRKLCRDVFLKDMITMENNIHHRKMVHVQ